MTEKLNHEVVPAENDDWVVFVHGAGGSIKTWKYQLDAFRGKANLLLIDLRDHGASQEMPFHNKSYSFQLIAKDILHLMDNLAIEKALFVALSMGSLIVQKIDTMAPNRIKGAIIAGGIFGVNRRIKLFARFALLLSHLMPFRLNYWLFSWIVMPKKNHQEARTIFMKQAKKLSAKAYRRWLGLYREFEQMVNEFKYRPLNFPLLAIMGNEDYVFLKSAKDFASAQAQALLHVIPDCGHICNIENAQVFNQLAVNYLISFNEDH